MRYLLFLSLLFVTSCASTVKYPVTVSGTHQRSDGTCAIQFQLRERPEVWTDYSVEACKHKVGDVLQ